MEEESASSRVYQALRLGGYLIIGGALLGFSIGVFFLFDKTLFGSLLKIGQFEVTSYFLSVFMPSFLILIAVGYVLATSAPLKKVTLSGAVVWSFVSVLCVVLSALSSLFLVSFFGALLIMFVVLRAYTKPTFKVFSRREGLFLIEVGSFFVASFALLFLFMDLIPSFLSLQTYQVVTYASNSLLMIVALACLLFVVVPVIGSRGAGLTTLFCFVLTLLAFLFAVQSGYVFFNAPAVTGLFLMVGGFGFLVCGNLVYLDVYVAELSNPQPEIVKTYSLLRRGMYCPYCGRVRDTESREFCSFCNRALLWTPAAPFCPSCGHLVPLNVEACPHCKEDMESRRVMFELKTSEERAVSDRLVGESSKRPSVVRASFARAGRGVRSVPGFLGGLADRSNLSMREGVYVLILTGVLVFVSFISYVRVGNTRIYDYPFIVVNYGFPLEWLEVYLWSSGAQIYRVGILWMELFLDVLLYLLVALGVVYLLVRFVRPLGWGLPWRRGSRVPRNKSAG